jgi:hypothetical protein
MRICKLCQNNSKLQKSHIIPRSILKDVKNGEAQLYVLSQKSKTFYGNVDPKELLLCRKCEQFLSSEYENYGTQLLKKHKNVVKKDGYIEFKKFNYEKWYLYYLSILWRASISSLNDFEQVELGGFELVMRHCIEHKSLSISQSISIDDVILITMFRVVDRSNRINDVELKNILLSLTREGDEKNIIFFLMVNGFLIQYHISKANLLLKKKTGFQKTNSSRKDHKYVKLLDITESDFLCDNFNWLISKGV